MFEIPDAKRVRREELYGSDSEEITSNDTTAQEALRAQLAALYGPIETTLAPAGSPPPPNSKLLTHPEPTPEEEEGEEAFEFNLFAPSLPKSVPAHGDVDGMTIETPTKPQKIILSHSDDEDAPLTEGKLLRQRKDGWWMADITEARREEFQDVAVDMETVRRWGEMRHYGWEKPWKVTIIHTGLTPAEVAGATRTAAIARKMQLASTEAGGRMDLDEKVKSKTKPNKKRRIILRTREKAAKEAAEAAKIKAEKDREAKLSADADYAVKRNARNRERKVKRREREKRKKEAARLGVAFVDEGSDAEDENGQGFTGGKEGKEELAAAA